MHQTPWLRKLAHRLHVSGTTRRGTRRWQADRSTRQCADIASVCQSELLEDRTLLATIEVNSWLDQSITWDGLTTLREAVELANSTAGADEIQFHPALNDQTIVLENGPITVNGLLNLHGPGSELLSISGDHESSVINISAGSVLLMDGVTIRDGNGSGITNAGVLQITDSVVTNNTGEQGGGINNSGVLSLNRTVLSENVAVGGAGIRSSGTVTIRDSTITKNSARRGESNPPFSPLAPLAIGGGIYLAGGDVRIIDSTISENTHNSGNGAAIAANGGTELTIERSTISDNTATDDFDMGRPGSILSAGTVSLVNSTISGGSIGIYLFDSASASITARNSTITENGGGIYNAGAGVVSLYNTIVAGNTQTDIWGNTSHVSGFNNLIGGAGGTGGFVNGVNGNLVGVAPRLGPLQNNAGPTKTFALLPDSPARDRGNLSYAPASDQRGRTRPQGLAVDIGSFELKEPVHLVLTGTSGVDDVRVSHVEGATTVTWNGVDTEYADVELLSISISSGGGDDSIRLESTPNLPITVNGNAGNDQISIGGGDYFRNIPGAVTIRDTSGNNQLTIDDSDSTRIPLSGVWSELGQEVVSGNEFGTFVKSVQFISSPPSPVRTSGKLFFDVTGTISREGGSGPDHLIVSETKENARYRLFGNDARDTFEIHADGLRSDIFVSGGDPKSAPGDSLQVIGTSSGTVVYTPDMNNTSGGVVAVDGHNITFTGLEPVLLENFDSVTLVTPRSYDVISVLPEANGWTRIGGYSGHPTVMLPFESLSFRDVRNVVLDTLARDRTTFQFPPVPSGTIYPPLPNDTISIAPGALDARGLEEFRIVTGYGVNVVNDYTLQNGPERPVTLSVDGTLGVTQLVSFGTAPEVDLEKFSATESRLIARDSDGGERYRIDMTNVVSATMANPQPLVRAMVDSDEITLESTAGRQIVRAGTTTFDVTPAAGTNRFEAVLLGDSQLKLGPIAFGEFAIRGIRPTLPASSTPDNVVITPISAGPQPEPPRPPIEIFGYGVEDTVTFSSGWQGVTPLPTDFVLSSGASDDEKIELLFPSADSLSQLDFTVVTGDMGAGPALAFLGDAAVENKVTAVRGVVSGPGMLHPTPISLVDIELLKVVGSDADEGLMVNTTTNGGLQVDSVNLHDQGRDWHFTSDAALVDIESDGGTGQDEFSVQYPEPDFRQFNTTLSGVEAVRATLDPAAILIGLLQPVRQRLTPVSGSVSTNNLFVSHDGSVSSFQIDATSIELLATRSIRANTFSRDLSLGYRYLGSEGQYVMKDVKFAGKLDLNIEHKDGRTNTTTVQEKNVVYEQKPTKTVRGAEEGKDRILLTKTGVKTMQGSMLEIDGQSGTDVVVMTETDSGADPGYVDEILVTGTGGSSTPDDAKVVLYHKQKQTTPRAQLDDLKDEKSEYESEIDALIANADQPLLTETAATSVDDSQTSFAYQGTATDVDLFLKNADAEPVMANISNPDGTTRIDTSGNVVLSVSDLDGTGIDPTSTFTTYAVVNTNDSGPGSLRAAIEAANASTGEAYAVVVFHIPTSDVNFVDVDSHLPGGDSDPDVFVISPLTALPALTRGNIVINGQSQHGTTGNSNPFGPEIVLSGDLAATPSAIAGLTTHFGFNGDVVDDVGISTVTSSGVSFVDGQIGEGVTFEPGGYIDVPNSAELELQQFTLSAWVRPDGPGPNDDDFGSTIIQKGIGNLDTSVALYWSARSQQFIVGSGNVFNELNRTFSNDTFAPSQFYHVAATFDGLTFKLYVNGELQGQHTRTRPIEYAANVPWTIGSTAEIFRDRPGQPNFPRTWNGVIDEVGIYNRALTASEVAAMVTPIDGLTLASVGNYVHGLNIQQFSGDGIQIIDDQNTVTGNYIGTNTDGTAATGNGGSGISLEDARGVVVGGESQGAGNLIAFNGQQGVSVVGVNATGNSLRGNSIHSNGGLGIDLGDRGVEPNDPGDADEGANRLQNYPVLSAIRSGTTTLVVGTLSSQPRTDFTLDFYANDHLDSSGHGEGQRWLGSISVQTDNQGNARFRQQLLAPTIAGELITATATDSEGNTSEFSGAFMATGELNGRIIVGGGTSDDVVRLVQDGTRIIVNGERMEFAVDVAQEIVVHLLAGNDTLRSNLPNNMFVDGGDGDDDLMPGSGNDTVLGGPGNDILNGREGIDIVDGGVGDDLIEIRGDQAEFDIMTGGAGIDRVVNIGGSQVILNSFNTLGDLEEFDANGGRIRGNDFDNEFDFRGVQLINVDSIRGDDGNDIIFASTRTDDMTYDGGNGDDTLYGQNLRDILLGGNGDDTILGGDSVDHINGGRGWNNIWSGSGDDRVVLQPRSSNRVHDFEGSGHDAFVFAKRPKKEKDPITFFTPTDVDGDGQVDDLFGDLWNNINHKSWTLSCHN
ncbi:MAG: LamG-like jellyroll fold domain-containing protein [Planctomycetaceae bacterium]